MLSMYEPQWYMKSVRLIATHFINNLKPLRMRNGTPLGFNFFYTTLQVLTRSPVALVHARHKEWRVREEVFHLLQRTFGSLRKEAVEEDCVGQVADLDSVSGTRVRRCVIKTYDKKYVKLPSNRFHSNRSDLANHRVKSERQHGCNRNTLRTRLRVKDFGRDNP